MALNLTRVFWSIAVDRHVGLHLYQTGFGLLIFWVSFRRPLTWRNGDPIENERLVRLVFRILAAALMLGGVSGLWVSCGYVDA
jgi:hypothetical protein